MGTTVLNPGAFSAAGLHVYAHCLREKPGGVTILVINANRNAPQSLNVPMAAERYTITAGNLLSKQVQLNGNELSLGAADALPQLTGTPTDSGSLIFAPASITFLAIPNANNAACQRGLNDSSLLNFAERTDLMHGTFQSPTPDLHLRAIKSIFCVVSGIDILGIVVVGRRNDV
jgi:hypothetical protein